MSKVAIITDSNSGISQSYAEQLGIYVVPMPFIIDEETYYEDISLNREQFYSKLLDDAEISTTQPSPDYIMNLWNTLLGQEGYDEIVHIPMSSGLSGSCSTAMALSKEDEFEGKVYVVDNQRISVTQRRAVMDAVEMAREGKSAKEIHDKLMDMKFESSIYIMVDTLKYLKKGGRVTPAAAALGTILKLKPVLQIQGEKLDAFAKARTITQAKSLMLKAVKNDIETRFGGDVNDVWIAFAHTENMEEIEIFKEEFLKMYPDYPAEQIVIDHLSLSVSCHIGPGSLAIACTKKM
ncbi:MAG: DegV family protein [Lachnospiraceae bacterium]|nr:DegV family protein [Lachnospiraceae bacterium]